eukprot:ANDGO_00624.mRNA.1 hypothetical protein
MSYFPEWGTSKGLVFTPCGPGTNRLCVISTEEDNLGDALDFLLLWKKEMPHRVVLLDIYCRRNPDVSFEEMPWLAETVGIPLLVSFSPHSVPECVTLDSDGNFNVQSNGVTMNAEMIFPGRSLYCKMIWTLRFAPLEWDVLFFGSDTAYFLPAFFQIVQHALSESPRRGHTVLTVHGSLDELPNPTLLSSEGLFLREFYSVPVVFDGLRIIHFCLMTADETDDSDSHPLQFIRDRKSSVLSEVALGLSLTPHRMQSICRYLSRSLVRFSIARQMASAKDDKAANRIGIAGGMTVNSSDAVHHFSLNYVLRLPPDPSASFGLHLVVEQTVGEEGHDVFVRSFDYIVDSSAVLPGITLPHRISLINSLSDNDIRAQLACLLLSKLPPTRRRHKIPSKTLILSWDFGTVSAKLPRRRVLFVGETRAGKTSTIQLLRGVGKQQFCHTQEGTDDADRQSTEVGGVHMMEIAVGVDGRSWTDASSERGAAAGAVSLFLRSAARARNSTVSQSHSLSSSSSLSAVMRDSENAIMPDAVEGSADDSRQDRTARESPLASNGGIDDTLAEIRNAASHIQSSCISVFDFAGQDLYRCLDPLFFAPSSMYVLVFDLLSLCAKASVSADSLASEIDRCILSWLQRISSMLANAGSQPSQRSVVILAGTRGSQFKAHSSVDRVGNAVRDSIFKCRESFANLEVYVGVDNPSRARGDADVHPDRPFYVLENDPHLEGSGMYDDDRLKFMKSFSTFILRQFGDLVSASRPVPLRYLFLEAFVLQRQEWSARSVVSDQEILSYVVPALKLGSDAEARDALRALIESGSFFGFCSGNCMNGSAAEAVPETEAVIVIRPIEFVQRCAVLISHRFLRSSANGYLQPNSSFFDALWQRIGAIQEDEVRRILCVDPVSKDGLCDEEKNCLVSTLCLMGILIPIRVVQMHVTDHPPFFLFTPRLHILRTSNVVRDYLSEAAIDSTQLRSCSLAIQIQTRRGSEVPSVPTVSPHVFYRLCSFLHVAAQLTTEVLCIGDEVDPLASEFPIAEREIELVDDCSRHRVRIAIMPGGVNGPFFAVRLWRCAEAAPLPIIDLFKKLVSMDTGIPAGSMVVLGQSVKFGHENQLGFVAHGNARSVPLAQKPAFLQRMAQFDEYQKSEPKAAATSRSDAAPKEWTRQQLNDALQNNLAPFLKYFFNHFDTVFIAVVRALNSFDTGTADHVIAMGDRQAAVELWKRRVLLNPMVLKSQASKSPVQAFCAFLRLYPEVLREVADLLELPVFI